MASIFPRWVVVDDSDPDIEFFGSWFETIENLDSIGNFGPAYQSTLHGTNSSGSLSYTFNGTKVKVHGSNTMPNNPVAWECFVDEISIGAAGNMADVDNNWLFCEQDQLLDGPHILTLNVTVASQIVWFDQIQYVPSANDPLDQKAVLIDNMDSEVLLGFGEGWTSDGPGGGHVSNMTTHPNAIFKYQFTGVSLAWYGVVPVDAPSTSTTGSYSIDDNESVLFLLQGIQSKTLPQYNQKFFETLLYSAGPHSIVVTYLGNSQTTPLTLDYLIIQNGTFLSTPVPSLMPLSSSIGTSTTATLLQTLPSTTSADMNGPKSDKTIQIVGGALGSLALVGFALIILHLRQRRKRRQGCILTQVPGIVVPPNQVQIAHPNVSEISLPHPFPRNVPYAPRGKMG